MTIEIDAEITLLTEQCAVLEADLLSKRNELNNAIIQKLSNESAKYPLSSFVGQVGFYDRPYKWAEARAVEFKPEVLSNYEYLKFNGIVTGKQLNAMYDLPLYSNNAKYYSFVIPDSWDEDRVFIDGMPIALADVYEILIFEV